MRQIHPSHESRPSPQCPVPILAILLSLLCSVCSRLCLLHTHRACFTRCGGTMRIRLMFGIVRAAPQVSSACPVCSICCMCTMLRWCDGIRLWRCSRGVGSQACSYVHRGAVHHAVLGDMCEPLVWYAGELESEKSLTTSGDKKFRGSLSAAKQQQALASRLIKAGELAHMCRPLAYVIALRM